MKLKLFIILAFLPLLVAGQITPGYDFRYDGDIVVVGNDTTLEGDLNYILTNVDFDITLRYLPGKTGAFLNGQPLCTFYANANYADTAFTLFAEHTLNADLTELLPARILEHWHYAAPTVDVNNYAETPPKATVNFIDVTTTIDAAIVAASTGDTIYIPDGTYKENSGSGYLNIDKQIYLQAVGNVIVQSTAVVYVIVSRIDGTVINGLQIDGEDLTDRGIFPFLAVKTVLNNCSITNYTGAAYYRHGSNSEVNKCVITGSGEDDCFELTGAPYSLTVNECYINDSTTNDLFNKFQTQDTSKLTLSYNKIVLTEIQNTVITSGNLDMLYNEFIADTTRTRVIRHLASSVNKIHNIRGNSFDVNGYGEGFALLTNPLDNFDYNITKNTLTTESGGGVNFNFIEFTNTDNSISITNNYFDIINGNAIFLDGITTGNTIDVNNNRIYSRTATSNDQWFTVRIEDLPDDIEVNIEGNVIKNPLIFGQSFGGHACIFLSNTINSKVKFDSCFGAGIASIIYKGDGGENTDAVIQGNITDRILNKGQRKTKIYNNTVNGGEGYGIGIIENQDGGAIDKRADSCQVYNNMMSGMDTALMINNINSLAANTFSNNNIFFASTEVNYNSVNRDLDWWQTNFSQDLNSFNTDPLLDANLCPASNSDAVFNGLNLGSPYNIGLVCGTSFPDPTTRNQTTPFYTIGAIVINKQINSVVRVVGGGLWGFGTGVVGY